MPPKSTIALELVLSDIRPKLFGQRPRYRVVHRNGATIEGRIVSVFDASVQFKDARGLVEIEKTDIASIEKAVPDHGRLRFLLIGVVIVVMLAPWISNLLVVFDAEVENLVFLGAFGAGVLIIAIVRTALRSMFIEWEPVFPPPGTLIVDADGYPVDPNR